MKRDSFRNAYISLGLLFLISLIGVTGFMLIENLSFTDAFFMTIITISTVGFKLVKEELSVPGMYFTAVLIIFSFGIFAYAVTNLTRYVVEGTENKPYKN